MGTPTISATPPGTKTASGSCGCSRGEAGAFGLFVHALGALVKLVRFAQWARGDRGVALDDFPAAQYPFVFARLGKHALGVFIIRRDVVDMELNVYQVLFLIRRMHAVVPHIDRINGVFGFEFEHLHGLRRIKDLLGLDIEVPNAFG